MEDLLFHQITFLAVPIAAHIQEQLSHISTFVEYSGFRGGWRRRTTYSNNLDAVTVLFSYRYNFDTIRWGGLPIFADLYDFDIIQPGLTVAVDVHIALDPIILVFRWTSFA